jgi:hypothetical protein
MTTRSCIGEPVSWLRLERFAHDGHDEHVRDHVAACPACKHCLDEIERDVVALPVLRVPTKRRWWTFAWPALAGVAAAAVVLVLLRPRDPVEEGVAYVKGIGEVVVDVVRERAGTVRDDVRTFRAGDRFKVVVTCPPAREVALDVAVHEDGSARPDHPLAPARIVCGNRIVLPGAFELTGDRHHRVCVQIAEQATACVTLSPE